jgi:small subunit ribosomal protein S27Ae
MKKREIFKIEGEKITRLRRHCPKCGEGVFLAEHKDRFSCGACGYTEFKSGGRKSDKPAIEEKPEEKIEKPIEKPESKEPAQVSEDEIASKPETEDKSQELSEKTKQE